jgi:hypothetical protein
MGFNFPNTPTNGALFTPIAGGPTYTWSAADTAWKLTSGGLSSGVYIGDNPPAAPVQGQLWWNATTGVTFIYYNDGNSSQWVQFNTGPVPSDPYPLAVANLSLKSISNGLAAINNKVDGSGVNAVQFANTGNITLNGAGGGIVYGRLAPNNIAFKWANSFLQYDIDGGGAASNIWADATNTLTKTVPGYHRFANGFMIQWGQYGGNGADIVVNFPTAFPAYCAGVITTATGSPPSNGLWTVNADQIGSASWAYRPRAASPGNVFVGSIPCIWLAVGW